MPHFRDYREMLTKLGDKVDAVLVDTPDHMHAPVAVAAMQMGKHVYCQKPLAHIVWECRQMRLWAEKTGVATQMGNQIHSHVAYRLGTKLIRDGVIGKVREVHSWIGVTGNQRTRLSAPTVTWTDGGIKPAHSLAQMPGDRDLPGGGSLFIGEDGTMVLPHVGMPSLYPVEKFLGFAMPDADERNHWHDWVDAAMTGSQTTDNFSYAGPLAEAVQLGNVATRLAVATLNPVDGKLTDPQKILKWNAEEGRFTNAPEANALLTEDYRDGFAVPECG